MSDAPSTPLGTFPDEITDATGQLEPFAWFSQNRSDGPVQYDEVRGCFDVFDYEGVRRVLRDFESFSSDPRTHPNNVEDELTVISKSILYQDPPRHDELRSVVDDFFRPGAIKELTPDIRSMADALVDEIVEEVDDEQGEFDLVDRFAYPLPVMVIAGLLGVPPADRARFREWSTTIVTSSEVGGEDENRARSESAYADMKRYFDELLETKRADPQEDLLSRLAATGDLSDDEMFAFAILLLAAGNLTTTNLISNAIWCFSSEECFEDLRGDADALELAIEEVLRYRSPVQAIQRWTREEVTLGNDTIPQGESVVAWIAAANRDPDAFEDADSFVPDRRPNRHVAFGTGIHTCLGAALARLEGRVALSTLLDRVHSIEPILGAIRPSGSVMIYGPRSMPVRFELA